MQKVIDMRTAFLFRNGRSQAVRLPKDLEFEGISEVEILQEGDAVILRPKRKSWTSFSEIDRADPDFLEHRESVIEDGRVRL